MPTPGSDARQNLGYRQGPAAWCVQYVAVTGLVFAPVAALGWLGFGEHLDHTPLVVDDQLPACRHSSGV